MFATIAEDLLRGGLATRLAWPGRISLAFIGDVVEALVSLAISGAGKNANFHFGPPDSPTLDEVIEETAAVLGVPRARLALPSPLWGILRLCLWSPLIRILPFALQVAAWRISLVITDGMVADGRKLGGVLPLGYTPWKKALLETYASPKSEPEIGHAIPSCSVVVPCRNERGNIEPLVRRLPQLGGQTEILLVEGHSADGTYEECLRVRDAYPDRKIRVLQQRGKGKGDAVLEGFANATGELLLILDADLSVSPEDLKKFTAAASAWPGSLVVGSRFVFPMERGAMRPLNYWGNRFFSKTLSLLFGAKLTDALCGTKVIWRSDYEQLRAAGYGFGKSDPFGDFDLLFGSFQLGLRIEEVPVAYRRRTYGTTQIRRFRDGLTLLRLTFKGRRLIHETRKRPKPLRQAEHLQSNREIV
jgi:hypothetical protein